MDRFWEATCSRKQTLDRFSFLENGIYYHQDRRKRNSCFNFSYTWCWNHLSNCFRNETNRVMSYGDRHTSCVIKLNRIDAAKKRNEHRTILFMRDNHVSRKLINIRSTTNLRKCHKIALVSFSIARYMICRV